MILALVSSIVLVQATPAFMVICNHYEQLVTVPFKPKSVVTGVISYPVEAEEPTEKISSFSIRGTKDRLNFHITSKKGGAGYDTLTAKITSDVNKGLSFIWTVETLCNTKLTNRNDSVVLHQVKGLLRDLE